MNEFGRYHPLVNFTYFFLTISFSMFFLHPVCLCITLVCAFVYSVLLKGRRAILGNLLYMLPVLIITAVMNPLFNHGGITILEYLPDGNPLTLESIVFGLASALMLIGVICLFSCCTEVMTSEKFICLFGRVIPALSLILSMTLRFVPRFIEHFRSVRRARLTLGLTRGRGLMSKLRDALRTFSSVTTWALESSIDTSDSMKARGYGLAGRSSFVPFTFSRRDIKALLVLITLGIYTFVGAMLGAMKYSYFPKLNFGVITPYSLSVFCAYLILCATPIIIELREVRKWR